MNFQIVGDINQYRENCCRNKIRAIDHIQKIWEKGTGKK